MENSLSMSREARPRLRWADMALTRTPTTTTISTTAATVGTRAPAAYAAGAAPSSASDRAPTPPREREDSLGPVPFDVGPSTSRPRLTVRSLTARENALRHQEEAHSEPRARYHPTGPMGHPTQGRAPTIRSQHASVVGASSTTESVAAAAPSPTTESAAATNSAPATASPRKRRPHPRTPPLVAKITHGNQLLRAREKATAAHPGPRPRTLMDVQQQHERSPSLRPWPRPALDPAGGFASISRDSAGYTLPEIRERRGTLAGKFPVPENAVGDDGRARRFVGREAWRDAPALGGAGGSTSRMEKKEAAPASPSPASPSPFPRHHLPASALPPAAIIRPSPRRAAPLFSTPSPRTLQARAALTRMQEEEEQAQYEACVASLLALKVPEPEVEPEERVPEYAYVGQTARETSAPVMWPAAVGWGGFGGFVGEDDAGEGQEEEETSRYEEWERFDFEKFPPELGFGGVKGE